MSTHNIRFLWRTEENYPSIIIKYPLYRLRCVLYRAGKMHLSAHHGQCLMLQDLDKYFEFCQCQLSNSPYIWFRTSDTFKTFSSPDFLSLKINLSSLAVRTKYVMVPSRLGLVPIQEEADYFLVGTSLLKLWPHAQFRFEEICGLPDACAVELSEA